MDEAEKYRKIAEVAAELDKIGSKATDELTYEEQAALEDYNELLGQHHEQAHHITKAQQKLARQRVRSNPGLMQVLKEEGLSVDDFLKLEARKPEIFQQEMAAGTRKYVQRLTGKAPGEKRGDPFFENQILRPAPENVQKARQAAAKSKGTNDDLDRILGALMGFDD